MNLTDIKKLSIKVMITSLIAAAALAVVAVLVGQLNDVLARALGTIGLVTLHAFAVLGYADTMEKSKGKTGLGFFQNTILLLIILSFFTSVFGVWELLPGETVGKLYLTYLVLLVASVHGSALVDTTGKDNTIDNIVIANYGFMAIVIMLLLPLIWAMGAEFGGFYYRLLGAIGIVDATLTILAVILHRLYLQKHPEEKSVLFMVSPAQVDAHGHPVQLQGQPAPQRKTHPIIWLLAIFIIGQVVLSLVGLLTYALTNK